jgi:hypothetical protein
MLDEPGIRRRDVTEGDRVAMPAEEQSSRPDPVSELEDLLPICELLDGLQAGDAMEREPVGPERVPVQRRLDRVFGAFVVVGQRLGSSRLRESCHDTLPAASPRALQSFGSLEIGDLPVRRELMSEARQ